MLIHLHKQAWTTPKVRAAIQASDEPESTLAESFVPCNEKSSACKTANEW